jgi:hypothetical protein
MTTSKQIEYYTQELVVILSSVEDIRIVEGKLEIKVLGSFQTKDAYDPNSFTRQLFVLVERYIK